VQVHMHACGGRGCTHACTSVCVNRVRVIEHYIEHGVLALCWLHVHVSRQC
jgi:hypothetical protein